MVKIEYIIFWILILAVIGIVIWMLLGSPTLENGLLTLTIFIATSEMLLWKAVFSIDKRNCIGSERIKLSFEKINSNLEIINENIHPIKKKLKLNT